MKKKEKEITTEINFSEWLLEDLKNVDNAKWFIIGALEEYEEDGDFNALMHALQVVAKAQGNISSVAKRARVKKQDLSEIFSGKYIPNWPTMDAIMHGLGFKFSVEPINRLKK